MRSPRYQRLSFACGAEIAEYFRKDYPDTPYEQVKLMKDTLNKIATEQQEQLIRNRYLRIAW